MARILYGVADEGFGHSSRSHVIGQHLIDGGHDVVFAASRKSLSYLRNPFGGKVKEIAGLSLVYQNGNLLPIHSILCRRRTTERAIPVSNGLLPR